MKESRIPNYNFESLLTILFIGLKLTDHINWSWWWVLSPMWIFLVLLFVYTLFEDR